MVKVAGHCNLACDHCYVYELRDSSWKHKPAVMSPATAQRLAERIAEHARNHALPSVRVVLHGGEPLLAGRAAIDQLVTAVRGHLEGATECTISVQSNGTLLTPSWLDTFRRHHVSVGISLDGDREANDLHRRHRNGRSSHAAVQRGMDLLRRPENRALYSGLLCTVDLSNDPVRTYEALLGQEPPAVDFLLPHATWEYPPPGHSPGRGPYGQWLLSVFDRWYSAPRRETGVRIFEDIMALALGGKAGSEAVGLAPSGFVVVDTDGSIEMPDSLKAAYDGAAATGLDIHTHDFDTAARDPRIAASREGGLASLADKCRGCPVVRLCGGGLRAHRFHPRTGFANPSVYCADLELLTTHIRDRVVTDARELLGKAS
ncbi:FxsB family radical SAM/SPASM domain protein [Streptomyces sp. GC420]|nr:FxsB family radical SAM/SPASM domain protein [Streptomyces sp. GC420]